MSYTLAVIRVLIVAVVICELIAGAFAQTSNRKRVGNLDGHPVELFDPGVSDDGFEPLGSAKVCVVLPAGRQCYTLDEYEGSTFGREPSAKVVNLGDSLTAILFTADSGGASGWERSIKLLRVEAAGGDELEVISDDIRVSNQSEWRLWSEPSVSKKKMLVIADYVWGDGETHYGAHRFKVSTYICGQKSGLDFYYLQDEFMTRGKYDLEKADVLVRVRPGDFGTLTSAALTVSVRSLGHQITQSSDSPEPCFLSPVLVSFLTPTCDQYHGPMLVPGLVSYLRRGDRGWNIHRVRDRNRTSRG